MLLSSLLLLLLAAILHAVTNAFMKKSRDKLAFAWWMTGAFCVLSFPVLFFIPKAEPIAWRIVFISGMLEAIYFFTLTRAYTSGDLSVVYPIARGSAPLFLLLWASVFLAERPTWIGVCGIFTIVTGLYLINLSSIHDWRRPLQMFRSTASRWALVTGVLISIYSAVDKIGIRYFPPLVYIYLLLFVCWIVLSIQWLIPNRRTELREEVRNQRIYPIIAAAIFGTLGYTLVLAAMRLSPVSYVGPVREVSVVVGTWIGIRYMKETGGSLRITASVLVVFGILLITIFGGSR
jgi:drug/metabolite transporter (DMT)-like permease